MKQIWHLVKKEFIQVFHEKPMIAIIFFMPLMLLFVLGYAITTDVKHISTVVCDLDNSSKSRELIEALRHSGYFDLKYYDPDPRQIRYYLDSGKASFALVIPQNFFRDVQRNLSPAIQLLVDGTDSNAARIALGYASVILRDFVSNRVALTLAKEPLIPYQVHLIEPEVRVWYNPNLRSVYFIIPALAVILLTMITSVLSGVAIVRERELGTLEQLMVTPIKPWQLILGKVIPFAILGFLELTFVMTVGKFWYQIPILGSIPLLFAFAAIFLLTTLGIGIFVSTLTSTQQQAMFFIWFFNIFFILMSGFFIPIENMPRVLQYLTYLNPVRYFMIIIREIFLKGSSFGLLWPQGLMMFLLGLIILTMSVLRFQKRIS